MSDKLIVIVEGEVNKFIVFEINVFIFVFDDDIFISINCFFCVIFFECESNVIVVYGCIIIFFYINKVMINGIV